MTPTSPFNYPTALNEEIIANNQCIGYLLIKYLDGLNVINFMEAVNGSEEFQTFEITREKIFYKIFMSLMKDEKIKIDVPYLHFYLDTCFIDEEGYVCPKEYHRGEPPMLRLFIHPTFTVEAFKYFCCTYKTASFQCYSRLLPLNTHTYAGDLIVVDYFTYKHSLGCTRELNVYEESLFKGVIF
jgi:hypothetical protein